MSLASSASSDQVHVVTYHFRCADIARGSSQAFDQAMQSLKRHFAWVSSPITILIPITPEEVQICRC